MAKPQKKTHTEKLSLFIIVTSMGDTCSQVIPHTKGKVPTDEDIAQQLDDVMGDLDLVGGEPISITRYDLDPIELPKLRVDRDNLDRVPSWRRVLVPFDHTTQEGKKGEKALKQNTLFGDKPDNAPKPKNASKKR